jgi:hypothetical protein
VTGDQDPATDFRASIDMLRSLADNRTVPTGILCDALSSRGEMPLRNGSADTAPIDQSMWEQLYFDLHRGILPHFPSADSLPSRAEIDSRADAVRARGVVPIVVADVAYNHPSERLVNQVVAAARRGAPVPPPPDPASVVSRGHAYFASALLPKRPNFTFGFYPYEHPSLQVTLCLPAELLLTNTDRVPVTLTLDPGDGQGSRPVELGHLVDVSYDSPGSKTLRIVAGYPDETLEAAFSITIADRAAVTPTWDEKWEFPATISYLGVLGTGIAYVLYGSDSGGKHTRLTKPIILADGFPGHHYDDIYALLNRNQFLQTLLRHGYDAVLLTYGHGADYIQRNAFVAVECIQRVIKAMPAAQNPVPLIVGGGSMGGIITRYALAYMEQQRIEHQTGMWLSLDAPHQGANVPPGGQHQIFALAKHFQSAVDKANLLRKPAAQQLMYYAAESADSTRVEPSRLHIEFYAELRQLNGTGYPNGLRRIALADGAGDGRQDVPDHSQTLKWSACENDVGGQVWSLPTGSAQLDWFKYPFATKLESKIEGAVNFDGAPGGQSDYNGQIAQALIDQGGGIYVKHDYDNPCFVPTVSAIDMPNSSPYTPVPANGASTPFNDYFVSTKNRPHVEISTEMCTFLYAILGITPVTVAWSQGQGLFAQEGPITAQWTQVATGNVTAFAVANDRVAWVTTDGAVSATEGKMSAQPVGLISSGCYAITMSGDRLAAYGQDGRFDVLEGSLRPESVHNQWKSGTVLFAIEGDRMVISHQLRVPNTLWGATGSASAAYWRQIAEIPGKIIDFQMWDRRLAVLYADGKTGQSTLRVKEGDLNTDFELGRVNVRRFALHDDRIVVINSKGWVEALQGAITVQMPDWRLLYKSGATRVALAEDRIGILTPQKQLFVREGRVYDTTAGFVYQHSDVVDFAMADKRLGVVLADGGVRLKDGALTNDWQAQPDLSKRGIDKIKLGNGSYTIN